jgi:hypothetical protein
MKKRTIVLAITAILTMNTGLYAQFGGISKLSKKNSSAPVATSSQPSDLIKLITLATDQGIKAMDLMATVFPPEKIAAFEVASKKYHESQSHRTDPNMNAGDVQLASDAFAEFAKVEVDWNSYRKDKATVVPQADHRLAIMTLADGVAITQIPPTIQALQAQLTSIAGNPQQVNQAKQLKGSIQLFTVVGQQMPKQVDSYKTVRGIARKISTAERMPLPPDPPADSLKDAVSATNAITELPA